MWALRETSWQTRVMPARYYKDTTDLLSVPFSKKVLAEFYCAMKSRTMCRSTKDILSRITVLKTKYNSWDLKYLLCVCICVCVVSTEVKKKLPSSYLKSWIWNFQLILFWVQILETWTCSTGESMGFVI